MQEAMDVSGILSEMVRGDRTASATLMPLLYEELRELAARSMRHERRDHTWQTTDLVHEAYLRLVDQRSTRVQDREHFLALAAQAVRRVLVDHARRRAAAARGGGRRLLTVDGTELASESEPIDVLALDTLLEKLTELDPRQARVVEMRFFAGLTIEESSHVLGVSPGTVKGDWLMARAFLRRELGADRNA